MATPLAKIIPVKIIELSVLSVLKKKTEFFTRRESLISFGVDSVISLQYDNGLFQN